LLVGLSLPQAIAVNIVSNLPQNGLAAYRLRHDIHYRDTLGPVILRLISLPIGLWALWQAHSIDPHQIKRVVGIILIIILVAQWLVQVEPRKKLHPAWTLVAFLSSGFLAGFCSMGGAFIALWVVAHDWSTNRSRGFMFFMFLISLGPQALLLLGVFRNEVSAACGLALAALPVSMTGTWLGLYLGGRLPRVALRRVVHAVLVLIALQAILAPFFSFNAE
jgi:uncharacterized membrane protein YfcA